MKATERGLTYLVTHESPSDIDEKRFYKANGFTEHYQPEFEYKHTGRIETHMEIKKIA